MSDKSNPFYATSGNSIANYEWQNSNPKTFSFSWKNHFLNKIHEDGNFLARIRLFPESLSDGGDRNGYKSIPDKYDDTKGTRSRDAIPNERGIIKYDVAYNIGKDQSSPPTYQYTNYKNNSIEISEYQNLRDGNSFSVWVKAYDILGNTKEERFVLHYDSSRPDVSSEELQKNVEEDEMNFTSSVRILGASDPHSGVKRIKYRFRAQSTGKVINDREYEYLNPTRDESYCNRNPCDSNLPTGESFGKTIDFHFSNCYVTNVSDVFLETVIMEMNIYNSAGLYVSRSMQISNLTSLRGVHNYFGPIEIKISDTFGKSVRIFWNWAPSCYSIQGFQFTYSRDGQTLQSEVIFKVQNWIILDYVEAGGSYHLQLYTLYGEEPKNSIKSVASNFSFSTPEKLQDSNSDNLSILYGVIAVLCICLVVVGCLIAWIIRSGACKRPKETREVTNARSPPGDLMSRPDTYDTVDDACNTAYQELGQISSPSNYDQLRGPNNESRQDKRTSYN
uniref:Uncharacterized protein n=1 Tax=Magallana gigas TaxID=29159 RepID=A0A8W8MD71_MAGGI|nr:uncharacterized protein LOC105333550 [Crassostrea gigas]